MEDSTYLPEPAMPDLSYSSDLQSDEGLRASSVIGQITPPRTPKEDATIDRKKAWEMIDQESILTWQGSYELVEVIGSGAWSKVYAANNYVTLIKTQSRNTPPASPLGPRSNTNRIVPSSIELRKGSLLAIKAPSHKMAHPILKNEARILTYLMKQPDCSDHIVEFYGEDVDTNGLVFARAERTLMDIITTSLKNTPATLPQTDPITTLPFWLSCTRQLISALSWLHTHNIVHGDLKPANILCTSGNLQIADFSSSFYLPPQGTYEPRPTDAITAPYASPELLKSYSLSQSASDPSSRHPTFASDIWALACTLLVAATGHEPYAFAGHEMRRLAMARDGGVVASYLNADDWRVPMRVKRGGVVEQIVRPALVKVVDERVDCEQWMRVVDEVTAGI